MGSTAAAAPPAPSLTQGVTVLYSYSFDPIQLVASQAGLVANLQLDRDFDFLWKFTTSTQTGLYSVYLRDASAAQYYSENLNVPIFGENFAGTGALPYRLPFFQRIPKGTTLTATFNNRTTNPNTVQLVLHGKKVA